MTPGESMSHPEVKQFVQKAKPRGRFILRTAIIPYIFLAPFGLLFIVFFVLPILYALYQSLFRSQRSGLGLGAPTISFYGLGNYHDVLLDKNFFEGLGRILLFGLVQVPVMLGLALLLALLLDSTVVRLKPFFRVSFFIPYAVPGVVGALIWGFLYFPQLSPIVQILHTVGLKIDFLGSGLVFWSMANIVTWEYTGYNMLIITAALQAIPLEQYESARIEGCTGFSLAWYIKIPQVAPALVLTCVLSIIGTLQIFTEPQVLTQISNSISSNYTPNLYAYFTAFSNNNYYYTAALSVVLAVVSFIFSFGFLRLTQRYSGV
jgi:multiple sugar transport system permease protein